MRSFRFALGILFVVPAFFFAHVVSAQSAKGSGNPSLSSVLNSDGSIDHNINGSFDPKGYRLAHGPNGEPRFVSESVPSPASGGCSDNWDTSFSMNGADSSVSAVVSDGMGNVYVGGSFTAVNTVVASRVAKWNGTTWSALGSGVGGGNILAMAISGTDLYVGGGFSSAGSVPANQVAKWDGSNWSALGPGLGTSPLHIVYALAASGTTVYAGGNFAGAPNPSRIARWDGTSWTSMGTGMNGEVRSLAVSGSDVYAGGAFTEAGGVPASGIAKWDGISWSALGPPTFAGVLAIAVSGTDVYVGGGWGGGIAKWNGSAWSPLGSGVSGTQVRSLTFSGADLYVGGSFNQAGGVSANGIARWDGSQWNQVGSGIGPSVLNSVEGIGFSGSTMIVGGSFTTAGGSPARNLASWSAGTWSAFNGNGVDGSVGAIAVSGTDVYLGGSFAFAGTLAANRVVKWNGVTNTWSALGSGVTGSNNSLSAIAVVGNKVYAGGSFTNIGGVSANSIAVWNGTNWAALGSGITGGNARVFVIVPRGEDIFVGGDFATAGGTAASRLAKWNGTTWSGFPGNTIPSSVTGIAFVGNDLYVSSASTTVENPNYLVKYDGTTWTGIAPGMGGHGVSSLAVIGSEVYISGGFSAVGGVPAARVAKWNGTAWSALGGGLPALTGSSGVSLGVSGNDLVAIGDFTTAAGAPTNYIARWNGSAWSALGNGITSSGSRVVGAGGDIFAGGGFTGAGCNLSPFFARWRENVWTGSASTDWHNSANWGGGAVPPANAGITIGSNNATISSADATVGSLIVTGGRTVAIAAGKTLTVTGKLDLSNGFVTGPGTLVVSDLSLTNSDVTDLASITVTGNLYLNGGKITGTGPVLMTACRATALSGGGATSFVTSPLTRCVNATGTYRFPVGTGTTYAPVDLSNITGGGNFTVDPKSGAYPGSPTGLSPNRLLRWWDLTTAGITQADLNVGYADLDVVGSEFRYRAFRINGGTATWMSSSTIDLAANRVTVPAVTSFSAWTLAEAPSTPASLSGRVTTASGRGAWGVIVSLTDDQNNTVYTVTNPFGYYRFPNSLTFVNYTVRVQHKKFTFTNPQQMIQMAASVNNANFQSSDH
jgi:trimeric autotransporter adhesin